MSTTEAQEVGGKVADLDSERLLRRVHNALVEDLARIQVDLAQIELLESMFGDDALPTHSALRGGHDILSKASEHRGRQKKHLRERFDAIRREIMAMEELLVARDAEHMEAFGDFIRERAKTARRDERAARLKLAWMLVGNALECSVKGVGHYTIRHDTTRRTHVLDFDGEPTKYAGTPTELMAIVARIAFAQKAG